MIGKTINHYKILEKIGVGGMGIVYKAEDTKLDRMVALKFLPQHVSEDPTEKQRFIHEAKAASALDYPNICTVHEIGETPDGQLFIAMAFYDGESLKERIAREPLPIDQAKNVALQIAKGLKKAHSKSITHRDIKPANIIVTSDGIVKILDFGLAKLAGRSKITKTGGTLGTTAYMSPEQINGEEVDHRADIWSFGVTLYEMLTGRLPFRGDYEQAVMYSILNEAQEPPEQLRPEIPQALLEIIKKALSKNPRDRYGSAADITQELDAVGDASSAISSTIEPARSSPQKTESGQARIFLSYKRNVEPDHEVAMQIYQALSKEYDIFIDQNMTVGEHWVERIMAELEQADHLITLLSAKSVESEMVQEELQTAHHLAKKNGGRPRILPVRIDYRKAFQYPLSEYLDSINWAYWKKEDDTARIIEELKQAISGADLPLNDEQAKARILESSGVQDIPQPYAQAQATPSTLLELPEGTMDPESKLYIERPTDEIAMQAIQRQGVTITVKAPRQMGKSSLLIRILQAASAAGKQTAFLDFQLFDKSALDDADVFFRQFCAALSDELEVNDRTEEYWQMPLGNSQRSSRYMSRYLLKEIGEPLVLAMDEVETMFDTEFRSDFFSMLRNWHNSRATKPIWKQLDLALVTSTEPYQLIANLNQSPFNVGEVIDLQDFTSEQIAELNQRHGAPLSQAEERQLIHLLSGHPYLTRRALYLVASQRISSSELFSQATDDRGPFGDHLRYHLFRLYGNTPLIDGVKQVIAQNTCPDERIFFRLRGAGLIRKDGQSVLPRCRLYADYFQEHIDG